MTAERFFHHLDVVTKWAAATVFVLSDWVIFYPAFCVIFGVPKSVWVQLIALCLSAITVLIYALVENEIKIQKKTFRKNIMAHPCRFCEDDCRGCPARRYVG